MGSFGGINKHFRGIGLASVLCSFVLNCYYTNLIAWCVIMFFRSATGNAGWHGVNETEAIAWFTNTVTGASTVGDSLEPTRLVWVNVAALAFVWACIFASLAFGVKWTGRIAYITVGLPVLMLMVLLVRSATLEGAGDGVKAFIGQWDMKVLSERPDVWTTAVTQVFFSIGVTTGVMTAVSENRTSSHYSAITCLPFNICTQMLTYSLLDLFLHSSVWFVQRAQFACVFKFFHHRDCELLL